MGLIVNPISEVYAQSPYQDYIIPRTDSTEVLVKSQEAQSPTPQIYDNENKEDDEDDNNGLRQVKDDGSLDSPVHYVAQDSIVLFGNGTACLHGQGDINYKTMNLKADFVRVNMDSSLIYASGVADSLGDLQGQPKFSDGGDEYQSNEMTYNLKTKKGYIRHAVTQQGEGYVVAERTKKNAEDEMYMAEGKYTTCDDHEHPHFYLALTKAKVKPGKYIATGPAYMVLADMPLPLAIPFGYFPFNNKYSSGLIMPTFDDNSQRGLGLRHGGYYFAISDYIDAEITGEIYTNKTWGVELNSHYVKRYKFSGDFRFSYRSDKTSEEDLPDYTEATNMSIVWTHRQDPKANPYSNFTASVNFTTSGYNRSNVNYYNDPYLTSQNTKSSSVTYTQRFPNSPWSLTFSAQVAQRTRDSTINLVLPSVNINMSRVYPFKRKNAVGKEKWYEKISLSYTGAITNSIETKENKLFRSSFVDDWKNGMKHTIPIVANFTLFKYLNVSPTINLTDRMYFKRIDKTYDTIHNQVVDKVHHGFYNVFDFNVGIQMSTKIYGFYIPIRKIFGDKIDRVRHVITPSIGFTYNPDFGGKPWNYYGTYYTPYNDSEGNRQWMQRTYSHYEGSPYGTPNGGKSGALTFSLANNIEMKIRNDKDTTGKQPFKIISIIDNFSLSGSYNFMADSLNLSPIDMNVRIKLWKNYTLNFSTRWDPYLYELNAAGQPVHVNKYRVNHGKFFRWSGTSISIPALTIDNNKIKKWFSRDEKKRKEAAAAETDEDNFYDPDSGISPMELNNQANLKNKEKRKNQEADDDGYVKAEIPWSISVNYTLSYLQSNEFDYDKMEYKMKWVNNLSFSGSISFGSGWRVSTSASYDFEAKRLSTMTFNVSRDLHCWSMSGYFVPFGPYKSYNFRIGVNASMLQDLKYDKRSDNSRNAIWW